SRGGGIYVENGAPEITGSLIARNTEVVLGGGIFLANADAVLRNNRITGNAAQQGGGIFLERSDPVMDNLLIANNAGTVKGGGLLMERSNPAIRHGTIAYNLSPEGPGLHLTGSSPAVTGSILYGNRLMDAEGKDGGEARQIFLADGGSAPDVRFSDVEGGQTGIDGAAFSGAYADNLDVDPAFKTAPESAGNEASGDFSLTPQSPVINAASTASGDLPATDIEGDGRVFNGVRADMGAFEFPNNPPTLPAQSFALPDTDEDAGRTAFALSELAPVADPEGHPTVYFLANAPEFGTLFQVAEDGTAQQLPDTGGEPLPLGAEGRLEYQPANRSDPYADRFSFRVSESLPDEEAERAMTSADTPAVTVSVSADNDAPQITSAPNTAVPVGAEYLYEIQIADPDQDDPVETLQTTAEAAPDWLTLGEAEDGTPTLTGVPTDAETGDFSITLRVTDDQGAFSEQSFGLTVDPQGILAVDAGADRTGAPGETLFFEAEGEGGDPLTYAWTVIDAGGAELKTGTGQKFSWAPDSAGLFSAVVTATDERGSVPAEDRVEVAVATGFEAVDENRREPPAEEQAAAIAGLRNLDPASLEPDAAAATVAEAAKLDLSPGQRSDVLAGMASIVAADGNPPADRIGRLLGAADNLVVDVGGDPADFLTPEQVDQSLNVLQALADAPELNRPGMFKTVETLDEIVAQGGESALTNDQIGRVGEILETAADRAVDRATTSGGALTATGFENVALDVRPLDLSNPTIPVSLGGTPPEGARLSLPPALLGALRDRYGINEATGRFTANGVTAGRGVLANAALVGPDGSELSIDGLSPAAEVTIPLKVDDRERPLIFDPAAGEWTERSLSGVRTLDDGAVTFDSGRLNRFALFEAASNPLTGEDRSDTDKVVDAIEDLGSGSGCFLGTFFK
ncbi:MAG: putative Ig domain-containing protein, partial [Desulfococcaceae bacterium]